MNVTYVHDFYVYFIETVFKKVVKDDRVFTRDAEGQLRPVTVNVGGDKCKLVIASDCMQLNSDEVVFNPLAELSGGTVSTAWLLYQLKMFIPGSVAHIMHSLANKDYRERLLATEAFVDMSKGHLTEKVFEDIAVLPVDKILEIRYNEHRKMIELVSPVFDDTVAEACGLKSKERVQSIRRIIGAILGTTNISQDYKLKSVAKSQVFLGLMLDLLLQYIENTEELLHVACGLTFDLDRIKEFRKNIVELSALVNRIGDTPLPAANAEKKREFTMPDEELTVADTRGTEAPVRREPSESSSRLAELDLHGRKAPRSRLNPAPARHHLEPEPVHPRRHLRDVGSEYREPVPRVRGSRVPVDPYSDPYLDPYADPRHPGRVPVQGGRGPYQEDVGPIRGYRHVR